MAYSECMLTLLNPLAERTSFSQGGSRRRRARGRLRARPRGRLTAAVAMGVNAI